MKKLVLLVGLGIIMLGNLVAQTDSTANKSKAEIKFDKTDYDLGKIAMGSNTFEFVFTNTGTEPLVLSNVAPGCGCTKADWPKEPIAKGKKGVIKTTYNAGAPGTFTKNISVYSNAKTPAVTLTFKAIVEAAPAAATTADQTKK
jgi:hypothetical protein